MILDLSKVSPGTRQDILRAIMYKADEGVARIEREVENWEWRPKKMSPAFKEQMKTWAAEARALIAEVNKELRK